MSYDIAQEVNIQWKKLYLPIVAGSVAVLALIGLSIICTMKKKQKNSNPDRDEPAKLDSCGM